MTSQEILDRLANGGALVRSNECSDIEITHARIGNRFFVRDDGYAYVLRTSEWLESREKAHREQFARTQNQLNPRIYSEGLGSK
jgi:hypothetical protein